GQGTFVNGKKVDEALVGDGACITFGDCEATFSLDLPLGDPRSGTTEAGPPRDALPRELWVIAEIPGDRASRRQMRLGGSLEIGSGDCGFQLVAPDISAKHARLTRSDTQLMLHDLDSTNGTWYREGRVYELAIPVEARFRVGPYEVWASEWEGGRSPSRVEFLGEMTSIDPVMHALFAEVKRVAPLTLAVNIQGETGTGKELIAKALHALSHR